jgi:hypothetical protein
MKLLKYLNLPKDLEEHSKYVIKTLLSPCEVMFITELFYFGVGNKMNFDRCRRSIQLLIDQIIYNNKTKINEELDIFMFLIIFKLLDTKVYNKFLLIHDTNRKIKTYNLALQSLDYFNSKSLLKDYLKTNLVGGKVYFFKNKLLMYKFRLIIKVIVIFLSMYKKVLLKNKNETKRKRKRWFNF